MGSLVKFSLVFATLVFSSLIVCNVEASRVARFFNKDPALNNPNERETAGYLDPKEYFPTGTENSYNNYYESAEGRRNSFGNGAGESGGFREGVNAYGRAAEFTTENRGAAGFGNGGGYGSGEWRGSNGGGGYEQGAEYVSGYGNGYNGNGNGNGNGYGSESGARYGNGNGNGNGEYIPNNTYRQENP